MTVKKLQKVFAHELTAKKEMILYSFSDYFFVKRIATIFFKIVLYKFTRKFATLLKAKIQVRRQKIILIIIFLLSVFHFVYAQKTFRRHFIIAYDVSTPFINAQRSTPAYIQGLENLFSNKTVSGFNEAYTDNLRVERDNGLPFFDKNRDEISFLHFNVAASEINYLRLAVKNNDEKGIVSVFNKIFIKNKNLNWSAFDKNNFTINDYFNKLLACPITPTNFGNGVSMSNFVFPLVLNEIDQNSYSEEYILIILSDFLTGSMLGNTKDLERVRDIYQVPYKTELSSKSPVSFIKREIDYMASQYYKIDFFQYSFMPPGSANAIGLISFKIKPKVGVLTPEDVALFVDGDLRLSQRGYQSKNFKTNETKIKFTHNKNLVPTELALTITLPFGKTERILFQDVIATKLTGDVWSSEYTGSDKLMQFDSSKLTYDLPALNIKLDSIINNRNFENLKFNYQFKTKYEIANVPPLNFVYSTERGMPIENINFSTKVTIIIMYIVLPILILIGLLIFLWIYGRPKKLLFRLDGYLDSFEIIDYQTLGKLLTPFKAWDTEKQKVDHLLIKGKLEYKSPNFPLNWNPLIHLQLQNVVVPEGFEIFLKQNTDDIKEFGLGNNMVIKKEKNNKLSFVVGIRQNDILKQVTNPELAKFTVEAVVKDSILFIKSELREKVEYNFHIGADLKDVWVGFDPGTTGSCIAVGSATENIILGEEKIVPSILAFEKTANFHQNGVEIPEKIYKYGSSAETVYKTTSKYRSFQSIKKLLGFKDIKKIDFNNGNTLELTGKDLASLLVKRLYKDINTYFNRPNMPGFNGDDYKRGGKFNPLRAVVAIPNNFTLGKIQDMIDCIGNLNQFKEIRYVYEAEAVLFYYLSNFSELCKGEDALTEETILVFDMGGATINATVVTTNKILLNDRPKYDIDFLGKIGYGIGGDTIDYCIAKFILSCSEEFPKLNGVNIIEKKTQLAGLALKIKKEFIDNYYENRDYLILAINLQNFINEALGINISIDDETSDMYSYFKKTEGRFKLFNHPLFSKTIYDNVSDAIEEVVGLSDSTQIDKVIFSGRSTAFPLIKETAIRLLKAKFTDIKIIALGLDESKIAVAKGACWYGINKNSARLNNLKTNASFGFKRTMSADKTDVKFYELVEMGCAFDTQNNGIDSFEGSEDLRADFAFDGGKVNYFQIMGKDASKILSEGQKHKFSRIASIKIDQITSRVAMKVNENDDVECAVKLESNQVINEKGVVSDQEIGEANEEHYTWNIN